jgi:hypothetical protein
LPDDFTCHGFADNVDGQPAAVLATEPLDWQGRDVRLAGPRCPDVLPQGDDQQDPVGADFLHNRGQKLEEGGIGPVQVLADRKHRLVCRKLGHIVEQCDVRLFLATPRRELGPGKMIGYRNRQQLGQQGNVRLQLWANLGQSLSELAQSVIRRILAFEACRPGKVSYARVESCLPMVWRAKPAQPGRGAIGHSIGETFRDPRFADAWLAGDEHNLSLARARPLPQGQQEVKLVMASDE